MKTLLATVVLVGMVWGIGAEVSAQTARPFIWHRVCDIQPGQGAAARALAREFMGAASRDGSTSGRGGVIAFQSVIAPFNQMHFMQFNADVSCFTAIAFSLECDGRDGRPSIRPSFKRLSCN